MTKRSRLQLYKKFRLHFNLWALWKFILLLNSVMGLFLGARTNAKGCQRNLQAFFGTVDQDGNGEIEQREASKVASTILLCELCYILRLWWFFYCLASGTQGIDLLFVLTVWTWMQFLRKLDVQMADKGGMDTKEGMSELMASSQFGFNFSYGGSTISAEEILVRACFSEEILHIVVCCYPVQRVVLYSWIRFRSDSES